MAKSTRPPLDDATPTSFPETTPPIDLYATSDIRFVMMEIGRFGAKIDRLIDDVGKQSSKINELERSIDRVKTGAIVAGAILSIVATLFWWALGDRVTNAVRTGLGLAAQVQTQPQEASSPPHPQQPPIANSKH